MFRGSTRRVAAAGILTAAGLLATPAIGCIKPISVHWQP
jgi:hypothetical protein